MANTTTIEVESRAKFKDYFTTGEAAKLLKTSPHILKQWTERGYIQVSWTSGGHRRYDRDEIERFLREPFDKAETEKTRDEIKDISAFSEISQSLFDKFGHKEALRITCIDLMKIMRCSNASISLYDKETGSVSILIDFNCDGTENPVEEPYLLNKYPSTALVIRNQSHCLINKNDKNADPAELALLNYYGDASLLVLPLVFRGESIGIVEIIDWDNERYYSDDDIHLAKKMCNLIALTVHNAQIVAQLKRQNAELEVINTTLGDLTQKIKVTTLLRNLAHRLVQVLDIASCDIYTKAPDIEELKLTANFNIDDSTVIHNTLSGIFQKEPGDALLKTISGKKLTYTYLKNKSRSKRSKYERAVMNVPIIYGDELLGILRLKAKEKFYRFNLDEERMAISVASKAAIAINNAGIVERLMYQNKEQKLLLDTANAFAETTDIRKALSAVARNTAKTFDISIVCFYYWNEEKKEVEVISKYNLSEDGIDESAIGSVFKVGILPLIAACISEKMPKTFYEDNPYLTKRDRKIMKQWNELSSLNIPIIYKNKVIGILVLGELRSIHNFSDEDISIAAAVANQAAIALNNAQMFNEIKQRNIELSTIIKAVETVTSTIDVTTVLTSLCKYLQEALKVSGTEIYYYNKKDKNYTAMSATYLDDDAYGDIYFPPEPTWEGIHYAGEVPEFDRCVEEKIPIVSYIDDPLLDEKSRADMEKWGEKATITLPLIYKTNVIGVASVVEEREIRRFSKEDVKLASTIISHCAAAMENANIYEREQAEKTRLAAVLEASDTIISSMDLDNILKTLAEKLKGALQAYGTEIYYYNDKERSYELVVETRDEWNDINEDWEGIHYKGEMEDFDHCIDTKEVVIKYIDDSDLSENARAMMNKWGEKAAVVAPIVYQERAIGIVTITEKKRIRRFTEGDIRLVKMIVAQGAVAIENARAYAREQEEKTRLTTVLEASELVTSTMDIENILQMLAQKLKDAMDIYNVEIYYYNEGKQNYELAVETGDKWNDIVDDWDGSHNAEDVPELEKCVKKRDVVITYIDDPDLSDDTRKLMEKWGETSTIAAPMIYKDKTLGIVNMVEKKKTRRYSEGDIQQFKMIVAQGTAAIANANAYEREQIEKDRLAVVNKRLHAIVKLSGEFRKLVDEEDISKLFAKHMYKEMGFKQIFVYIYNKKKHQFHIVASYGGIQMHDLSDMQKNIPAHIFQNVIDNATNISNSFLVNHSNHSFTENERKYFSQSPLITNEETKWKSDDRLFIPLISEKNQAIGYVEVYGSENKKKPSTDFIALLEVFTARAASEISLRRLHGELETQAITDALTGLYNRRYLIRRMEEEIAYAQRYEIYLSVLMIDIDDFKDFNDSYGHPQGDVLLIEIAKILRSVVREKVDMVARYGGEEFLIMLARTDTNGAEGISKRLLKKVENHRIKIDGTNEEVSVTISVGISSFSTHGKNTSELINKADNALYKAKHSGKNCLKIAV